MTTKTTLKYRIDESSVTDDMRKILLAFQSEKYQDELNSRLDEAYEVLVKHTDGNPPKMLKLVGMTSLDSRHHRIGSIYEVQTERPECNLILNTIHHFHEVKADIPDWWQMIRDTRNDRSPEMIMELVAHG